jgi:hypothetical protein
MSARYWVQISAELMAAGITWPDGMRMAGEARMPSGEPVAWPWELYCPWPWAWYLVEDDGAPPELEGREVELVFRMEDCTPVVVSREPLP